METTDDNFSLELKLSTYRNNVCFIHFYGARFNQSYLRLQYLSDFSQGDLIDLVVVVDEVDRRGVDRPAEVLREGRVAEPRTGDGD